MSESQITSDIEREKWQAELALRHREVALKEEELKLRRKSDAKSPWTSPLFLAVSGAALAVFGNLGVAWYNGRQTQKIEGQKAEAALILEVVKTNDPDKAAVNLAFLLETGLVSEDGRHNQISAYLNTRKSGQGPSLALSSSTSRPGDQEASCASTPGDHVVVGVHWGDSDGGLSVRTAPNATRIGVIPTTGTGITVGSCERGWCQVRYQCLNGWAFAQYLSLRTSRLHRVTGIASGDRTGLTMRKEPRSDAEPVGSIPGDTADVIVHICQPVADKTEWCEVTFGQHSGWVPQPFLKPQDSASLTASTVEKSP